MNHNNESVVGKFPIGRKFKIMEKDVQVVEYETKYVNNLQPNIIVAIQVRYLNSNGELKYHRIPLVGLDTCVDGEY